MGFWDWLIKRFVKDKLRSEVKRFAAETLDTAVETSIDRWVESAKPPKDIENAVRNYTRQLKEEVSKLIEEKIDEALEG